MTEPEFKVGQLVQAEWPDGRGVIGSVRESNFGMGLVLDLPDPLNNNLVLTPSSRRMALDSALITFTVVKEAPIPEPTGRYALALQRNGIVWRRGTDGRWYAWDVSMAYSSGEEWGNLREVVEVIFPGVPS